MLDCLQASNVADVKSSCRAVRLSGCQRVHENVRELTRWRFGLELIEPGNRYPDHFETSSIHEIEVCCLMNPIPILFQDEHIVAVHKPSGLLMHRTRLAFGERECLLQTVRDQIGQRVYPIHRLDRPTSGLVVFGLSSNDARAISEQFVERRVKKTYQAVVRGHLDEHGTIDTPLQEKLDSLADARSRTDKEPQIASTAWTRVAQATCDTPVGRYETARYSLFEVHPKTGRQHQIRRHLRRMSHPIIGDRQYGDRDHNRFFEERFVSREMLLAATSLEFAHPSTDQPIRIECPLTSEFQRVLTELGCSSPDVCAESLTDVGS